MNPSQTTWDFYYPPAYGSVNGIDIAGTICLIVFIVTLVVLIIGKFDETAVALLSMAICALIVYVLDGIPFPAMLSYVGWDTVLFITSMMIIISVLGSSGMFQYVALILARRTEGNPRRLFIVFMVFVFVVSLFFHPLPTLLIIGAFTVEVCDGLGIDYRPFLISEAVVANFSSFPSPIGSIPNMIVVSLTKMDIGLMFVTLFPLSAFLLLVTTAYFLRYYRQEFAQPPTAAAGHLFTVEPSAMIRSKFDFYVSVVALTLLIAGMVLVPAESAIVAMIVAGGLLVMSFERAKILLSQLSWDTVFFIVGLFGIVAALNATGATGDLVTGMAALVGSNVFVAIFMMIWMPGLVFSILDTVPVATFFAPMAAQFSSLNPIVPLSVVTGLNFSVYVIPFGDAPNVYLVNLAEENGRPITWRDFTKITLPLGLVHMAIATVYLFAASMIV